jgi:hypothetical protein
MSYIIAYTNNNLMTYTMHHSFTLDGHLSLSLTGTARTSLSWAFISSSDAAACKVGERGRGSRYSRSARRRRYHVPIMYARTMYVCTHI